MVIFNLFLLGHLLLLSFWILMHLSAFLLDSWKLFKVFVQRSTSALSIRLFIELLGTFFVFLIFPTFYIDLKFLQLPEVFTTSMCDGSCGIFHFPFFH